MPTFTSKEEAIEFYRHEEPSLRDMPDYLIGCILDFSRKYDNYDEYVAVEHKMQTGKPLTKKEQKKYGHLKFEKVHLDHPKGTILHDHITVQEAGTFDDIGTKEGFEKYNKYGLTYNEPQEAPDTVKFKFQDKATGDSVIVEKSIDELNSNPEMAYNPETWDIKHTKGEDKKKLEE
jgi:hypothetical protein